MNYNSLAAIEKKSDQKQFITICNYSIENISPILQDYTQWGKFGLKKNTKKKNSVIQFPLNNSSVRIKNMAEVIR